MSDTSYVVYASECWAPFGKYWTLRLQDGKGKLVLRSYWNY